MQQKITIFYYLNVDILNNTTIFFDKITKQKIEKIPAILLTVKDLIRRKVSKTK